MIAERIQYQLIPILQRQQMLRYPLQNISKEQWGKKVNATYMYSIPAEDQALPILEEIVQILETLHNKPINQVIAEEHIEYFLTQVFPVVCQKILKSRYFKSAKVLTLANRILELTATLTVRCLDLAERFPAFAETLITVFSTDEYYYKTNNQFSDYRSFAHGYIKEADRAWVDELKEGDLVDVLKQTHLSGKASWSRGKVITVKPTKIKIEYLHDYYEETISVDRTSYMIAPYKSRSHTFDWRMSLKANDLVDCEDHYGGWYGSTIQEVTVSEDGKRQAKVVFKVYDPKGNKEDEKGHYFGLNTYNEDIDVTSPKIQPYGSVVKDRGYYDTTSRGLLDNDDLNDSEFEELSGQRLYALPRKKCLSEFLFNAVNSFGRLGGFTLPIEKLENINNIVFLSIYVKGLSGVSQLLHKKLVKEIVQKLKPIIERHIFTQTEQFLKEFTKERSQMLFSGFKLLQRRIYSMEAVYEYENEKKMKLVDKCLQSESLKRKLQGLNELKDVVKSLTYSSQRNKGIKTWIKQQKLFQKIYITNSHVQLIKKSQQFFRYLINESILQVTDLQRLYKIAQKGDYESRISLYKLFQQVSHIFKKPHVDFLIDTILQSQLALVLNEDIDLLNQMSKFSNYFPKDKVRSFFESIILGESQHEALYEYATKKYCEIVAKGYEMKSCRRDIIHSFISRLTTANINQVSKVLKGIFEGIGVGEYGKKDLNQILAQENIDEVVIAAIRNNRDKPAWGSIVSQVLSLLAFIYKLSYKVKVYISTLRGIWNELKDQQPKRRQYYKWVNQLIGCEQGIGEYNQLQDFQSFFRELFPAEQLGGIRIEEFALMRSLILELNKKHRYITPVHTLKELEYRRKVEMHELKLYPYFMLLIFNVDTPEIYEKGLDFFLQIYNAKDNELDDICALFDNVLLLLQTYKQAGQIAQVRKTLRLLNIIIDNSEKRFNLDIESLITKEKTESVSLIIINDIVYVSEYSKKKEISVSLNMTLYQFKKLLTTLYTIDLQEIKLTQERQIPDYYNSRTIKQLPINFNDPLTLSRRYVSTYHEPQMLLNGRLNPKAIRCFKVVFERYSTNGLMSKDQCHDFTCACLGTVTKRYEDKINALYTDYDYDNDGFLEINGFLAFYEKAAQDNKGSTVWSNLKNFGVNSDFKFFNETDSQLDLQRFPRKRLSNNPAFYETLFELLHNKELSSLAFDLLKRLPISRKVYQEVLGIGRVETREQLDVHSLFKAEDHYSYFYKLNIIAYLSESAIEAERAWVRLFIENKGVQLLYLRLKDFMAGYSRTSHSQEIEMQIINYSIKLLYEYFLRCFADKKSAEAIALLNNEADIDDKVEYLVTGYFPKIDQRLKQMQVERIYEWIGEPKQQVCSQFIRFFRKVWVEWGDKIQKDHGKLVTFQKVLSIVCLLQINEDPSQLISQFATFFKQPPSNKILRQLYCLILALCFYSTSHQNLYISELFQHITLANITSEYFRILAVLVSRFGMEEERVSAMPQVLLRNILNEKNQLTIQGCAKLLSNFHLGTEVAEKEVELLWENCLFGRETSCKKEATRQAIYELILKICENNKELTDKVVRKTLATIDTRIRAIKITYSTQVNQRSPTSYAGMKNLGNICYMNSMVQQLFMNRNFRHLLLRIDDHKEPVWALDSKQRMVDDNILHQIQRIFGYLERTTRIDFAPSAFCVAYKPFGESVNIMIQQDVQQFVSMFFDRLEINIKDHPLRRLIDNFYTGKTANLFSCHDCKQTKKVEENFYSLTLQVKSAKNLAESFSRFILGQLISDYKCDFCGKKADVSKKTRISKAPENLILHLKRIDFNMDTFINQKITNKHEFPTAFNLYPYSLDYFEKEQLPDPPAKDNPDYQYDLTGIICHIGNAEMGHYISYIKNEENKWFEFNDSLVNTFNPSNIETECYGGSFTYDDDYDWDKRENSKSAYLLIYRRSGKNHIQLQVKSSEEKQEILQALRLAEDNPPSEKRPDEEPTESQEESSQKVEDSEKEKQIREKIEMEQIEMIRKQKSEDNIDVDIGKVKGMEGVLPQQDGKLLVLIKDEIEPFMLPALADEIEADNQIHFFQKCLASASFSKFFAKLLILPQNNSEQMIKLCQKLTFGFWLKSPAFKELLYSLTQYIKQYPSGLKEILIENTNLVTLLIENSEIDVRTNIANFLAAAFGYYLDDQQLSLLPEDDRPQNQLILSFLDNLFSLIPTTVSKCWTKFNQYFQFWYQFSRKGGVAASYMVRKQFLKHFIDYFLDKKSPLGIYKNRPTIGSSYANPNFTMLLRTIESLLEFYLTNKIPLSTQERLILINYQFIEKLITDKYDAIASKIVRVLCPGNLHASEKIAVVLLKGLSKSNYENVQTYLDVLHEYILIQDSHQRLRMQWALGQQTLIVSTISKTLSAMNSYSLQDRIYEFQSGLHIENGTTLLQPIFTQNKRTQNLCILCLQELLKLCTASKVVRDYVWALGPPSFVHGKYVDFFQQFINRYLEQAKRMYGYSGASTAFNKEEVGKNVKRLYDDILQGFRKESSEGGLKVTVHRVEQKDDEDPHDYQLEESPKIDAAQRLNEEVQRQEGGTADRGQERAQQAEPIEQEKVNEEVYLYQNQNPIIRTYEAESNIPGLQKLNSGDSSQEGYYSHLYDDRNRTQMHVIEQDAQIHIHPAQINVHPAAVSADVPYFEYVPAGDQPAPNGNGEFAEDRSGAQIYESDKQNNYYSSQEENLLSDKEKQKEQPQEEVREEGGKVYHPIKFTYRLIDELQSGMENVRIEQHESEITLLRTYPTGITNKAFTSSYSHKKVSQRLSEALTDTKTQTLPGYFVSNNTKSSIRLQTDDGSYVVRSLDSAWVWSSQIMKIWVPERFSEWPQWSLYSEQGEEKTSQKVGLQAE